MATRSIDWNTDLRDQLAFAWEHQFLPRMAGLTDREYLWEPVPGCWSIREAADGRWVSDWEEQEPTPPPVTTIAWRMVHIADLFAHRTSNHFGDGSYDFHAQNLPATAESGLALVSERYAAWQAGVQSLGEEGLARPCGPAERFFAAYPLSTLILHINREFIHHAAEIMLLRDLYRAGLR